MIPIVRQCELLDLLRSSFYYRAVGEDEDNLTLMRLIDEEFTRHPFYGVRRMKAWLPPIIQAIRVRCRRTILTRRLRSQKTPLLAGSVYG